MPLIQQQLGHASSLHTTTAYLRHISPETLVIADARRTSTSLGQRGANSERWTHHGARDVSDGPSGKRSRVVVERRQSLDQDSHAQLLGDLLVRLNPTRTPSSTPPACRARSIVEWQWTFAELTTPDERSGLPVVEEYRVALASWQREHAGPPIASAEA